MVAPTLLIGLGGTGAKIVSRVSKLITEDQRKRIGFAVFDTDVNELRDIQEENPFIKTVQTSTKLSVGEYLNIDTHARDEWFPVNAILNSKTLTEGAGQVRAISRLAFDTSIRAGHMNQLHAVIESLYKVEAEHHDQALRVIIVSSLAGGTGSGLILPVALYVKNFLATRFQQSANIVRGFFILPEVFFEVIHGQSERNNLMCNAYAALRELDAFLMKGDGTLAKKYHKTVRLEFPRVGSDEFDEYHIRPYDFCFLFDAQNTAGRKLNDFNQYLDHAANCIYSQSIGPMNKRSNSSEDNTIRELCEAHGRNRYAGAGCSMLDYPVDDVKEYVALKWTQQTVSDQWLKFDKMYLDKHKINAKMRSEGVSVRDINPAEDYITTVDALSEQKDPFALSIRNQCLIFDADGYERTGTRWQAYIDNLIEFVESKSVGQEGEKDAANNGIKGLEGGSDSWDDFVQTYRSMQRYYHSVQKYCESVSSNLAYTIFKAQSDSITKDKRNYQLETYLCDSHGRFIHPNAVRYFLYQTENTLSYDLSQFKTKLDGINEKLQGFEKTWFDDDATEEVETVDQLSERKISLTHRIMGKLNESQLGLKDAYRSYMGYVSSYRELRLKIDVIEEGLEYVRKMSEAFRVFYMTFESKTVSMKRRLAEISKKYQLVAGKTTRYVCASDKCMNRLVERIPYTGSAITIDGELADEIYSKVRQYALLAQNDKPINGQYYSELFDQGIVGYYQRKMMETYGPQIDMDIITALECEAEIEENEFDLARQEQYVRKAIDNTRKMSTPFIERPLGEQREPISACTYHPDIEPNDDSPRANLIAKELRNYGGIADCDIGRNRIMFYQSIYGLRANRLSKFAPAVAGVHGEGAYYKAYYELVRKIKPVNGNMPVITPHIDRTWHLISYMPDLDEVSQKDMENRIYRAFILGLLYGKISQKPISEYRHLYKLELKNCAPEEFVVSNKTPCDQFYEVLDALVINPVVVDRILDETESYMRKELNAKITFSDSALLKQLQRFRVVEYEKRNQIQFKLDTVSIFDFPALVYVSAPDGTFDIESGTDMMRVILDEIYQYMKPMIDVNALDDEFGDFVQKQYALFTQNRIHFEPYRKMSWFIGELKRVAVDYASSFDLDDMRHHLDDIDEGFEAIMRNSQHDRHDTDLSKILDNDDKDIKEINEIAGASRYLSNDNRRDVVEPEVQDAADVSALIQHMTDLHQKQMYDLERKHIDQSQEFERRLLSLSQEIEVIKKER